MTTKRVVILGAFVPWAFTGFLSVIWHTTQAEASCSVDELSLVQEKVSMLQLHQHDHSSFKELSTVPSELRPAGLNGVIHQRFVSLQKLLTSVDTTCVPTNPPSEGCDMNGRNCSLCGTPLKGRGYDGVAVYSSTLAPGDTVTPPDYIVRDDCGNQSDMPVTTPLVSFTYETTNPVIPYTNAWCETNWQKICADSMANRDYLYQAKTLDVPRGSTYDFYYCKYNGFLTKEARTAVASGFDELQNFTAAFCSARASEYDIDSITRKSMLEHYVPGLLADPSVPTVDQARFLGAWLCSMGGTNGQRTGAGCDIAYCHYTYGDLDPSATSNTPFCMYEECEGWDPLTGMPVADVAVAAQHVGEED